MKPGAVLVTGAFGQVGSATVRELVARGAEVVAADIRTDDNQKAARRLPATVAVCWADLSDADDVGAMIQNVGPAAIVHLAAIIPPGCYRNPRLAREVNVGGTANLVRAAQALSVKPRFVLASSVAVYGPRNPHINTDLLTADTPLQPIDSYGQHKVEAEAVVRASTLDWVILRLGAVVGTDLRAMGGDSDALLVELAMPVDGRIHSVDVRDVATAFCAAITADVVGEVLLIGGDDTHRNHQGDLGSAVLTAIGLVGVYPPGRRGDPSRTDSWFVCDWMNTARAQEKLAFQHHSWPDLLAEIHANHRWLRHLVRLAAPFARAMLKRRAPYRGRPGQFSDPWTVCSERWPGVAARG